MNLRLEKYWATSKIEFGKKYLFELNEKEHEDSDILVTPDHEEDLRRGILGIGDEKEGIKKILLSDLNAHGKSEGFDLEEYVQDNLTRFTEFFGDYLRRGHVIFSDQKKKELSDIVDEEVANLPKINNGYLVFNTFQIVSGKVRVWEIQFRFKDGDLGEIYREWVPKN